MGDQPEPDTSTARIPTTSEDTHTARNPNLSEKVDTATNPNTSEDTHTTREPTNEEIKEANTKKGTILEEYSCFGGFGIQEFDYSAMTQKPKPVNTKTPPRDPATAAVERKKKSKDRRKSEVSNSKVKR